MSITPLFEKNVSVFGWILVMCLIISLLVIPDCITYVTISNVNFWRRLLVMCIIYMHSILNMWVAISVLSIYILMIWYMYKHTLPTEILDLTPLLLLINGYILFGIVALSVFNACFISILCCVLIKKNKSFKVQLRSSDNTDDLINVPDLKWEKYDKKGLYFLSSWFANNRIWLVLTCILNIIFTILYIMKK